MSYVEDLHAAREEARRLEAMTYEVYCECGHRHSNHRYGGGKTPGCSVEIDRYEKCPCESFREA